MNKYINQLIQYGLKMGLLQEADVDYTVNLLLDLFHLDHFQREHVIIDAECVDILDHMLDYALQQGLIEDNMTSRDLFDTRIMNCLMPRPSEVEQCFMEHYRESPMKATDYFYQLSIASQYIRKKRTDQNIRFQEYYKYGNIETGNGKTGASRVGVKQANPFSNPKL